jgi:hypothetical protein
MKYFLYCGTDERKIHMAKKMQRGNNKLRAHSLFCFRKSEFRNMGHTCRRYGKTD